MPQPRSWTMSAVVIGTYLCAMYGARGTAVSATVLLPRPAARTPATRPATVERPTAIVAVDGAER